MDTVHLIGAEDVRTAGNRMAAAAEEMRNAAATIDSAATTLVAALRDFEINIGAYLTEFKKALADAAVGNLKP